MLLCLVLGTMSMVSCGLYPSVKNAPKPNKVLYDWYDNGGEGDVSIQISLSDQIAKVYRGERQIAWSYVATGQPGYSTPAGDFKIVEKKVDKYSNRFGWMEDEFGNMVNPDATSDDPVPEGLTYVPAPMPYWMRLTWKGVGMHGGLIPNPGQPASHGCIRMPKTFVPLLFDVVELHTPVTIRQNFAPRARTVDGIRMLPEDW